MSRIVCMSYNVLHFEKWRTGGVDYDAFAGVIRESGADVVGLNEVYGASAWYGAQAEKLAAGDKDSLERIKFIRKALWGPLNDASADYFKKAAAVELWQAAVRTLKEDEKITVDGTDNEKTWADGPFIALLPL